MKIYLPKKWQIITSQANVLWQILPQVLWTMNLQNSVGTLLLVYLRNPRAPDSLLIIPCGIILSLVVW